MWLLFFQLRTGYRSYPIAFEDSSVKEHYASCKIDIELLHRQNFNVRPSRSNGALWGLEFIGFGSFYEQTPAIGRSPPPKI